MFVNDQVFAKGMDGSRQATLQLHRSLLEREVNCGLFASKLDEHFFVLSTQVMRLETRLELEIELRRLLEAALGYGDKVLLESSQVKPEIPVETSDLLSDVSLLESTVSSLETQACELREQVDFARSQRETLATQKYINESQETHSLIDDIKTKLNGIQAATKVNSPSHNTSAKSPARADKPISSATSLKSSSSSKSSSNSKSSRSSSNANAPRSKTRRPLLPKSTPFDNSSYSVKRQEDKPRTPAPSSWTSSTSSSPSSKSNLFSGKLYASVDVPNVAYLLKNQTKHTANRIIKSLALPSYRRREQSKSLDAGTVSTS